MMLGPVTAQMLAPEVDLMLAPDVALILAQMVGLMLTHMVVRRHRWRHTPFSSFATYCFFIFDAEVDWRLSTAYLVCRGRLSRSLTSCFSLNTVSWAARRLWEKSTFWMAEPVLRVRASPSRGKAGTALDLMKSGAAPWAALRSFLAGKCSQEARPKS